MTIGAGGVGGRYPESADWASWEETLRKEELTKERVRFPPKE
eukprot:SAG25_NODE_7450_length_480_cov_0.698163_1_plen_41_part_10